jgi:hypothetical protein
MNYTKGEWKEKLDLTGERIIYTDYELICTGVRHWNKDLIKSAPEMYEALKELSEYIKYNMGNARPIYEKAVKALQKAEGK